MANSNAVVITIATILVLTSADVSKRTIERIQYPDCDLYPKCVASRDQNATVTTANFPNLMYVRATTTKDCLHFVFTNLNLPGILVVHTRGSDSTRLKFNWDLLLSNSSESENERAITSTGGGDIKYSFAVIFSRLIEYDDVKDDASLPDAEGKEGVQWNIRNFTQFDWHNMTVSGAQNSIVFNTSFPQLKPFENNTKGYLAFKFEVNGDDGRDDDLPRMIFNANNTQFDFELNKYVPKYNKSRFALEMSVIANHSGSDMSVEEIKSIDDEYSPGVFRLVNWFTGSRDTGYVQYKPVCYLNQPRARNVGTDVKITGLKKPGEVNELEALLSKSLAQAYFGPDLNDTKLVSQMSSNVSFGLSLDGFYLKNNYTVWTATIGYGTAPVEAISLMVIIIISAGLGIPVLIIIFGGIYVIAKRRRGYARLAVN